ncbi:MAG: HlyD family efflux transporter periplasmic adaptor subunit [Ghiorsea sp.]
MWFDQLNQQDDQAAQRKIERLENYHRRSHIYLLSGLLSALILFVVWASVFRIDEVSKASGEVIASSGVQMIQAVDGGVLSEMNVREGDVVQSGEVLARLDQTRIGASVAEVKARLYALKARAIRLRAEVTSTDKMTFPVGFEESWPEVVELEVALFKQRKIGLNAADKNLEIGVGLARQELAQTSKLRRGGDASGSELLRAKRALNDSEAKLINLRNQFLEDAGSELTKAEDGIAQNEQVLARYQQQEKDSVFIALVPGIVKNVSVTTIGGVLSAGEELMQIIPVDDDLIIEAKVSPKDIAKVKTNLEATIRFDPFDYTIYGGVKGKVIYVSADTLKEDSGHGTEIFYRVHIVPQDTPVVTTTGRSLTIIPGMTAQVDIRTGDRTLMDFLLKPLKKTLSESFGER